ncbi:MAG TPA: aldo/keto reductase [Erysipelotrichaceae bacterium]|nr:aldo/keto reductase [Erysipelotrichaceae bacterium]
MRQLTEVYTLYNGVKIPKVGYGTWQIPNSEAYQTTLDALSIGYRHVDTAKAYRNEKAVGKAIKDSGLNREDIFVTSKLPAEIKGYDVTLKAFNETMSVLGLDYLDLYLIHAPWPWDKMGKDCTKENIESWKAMEVLYKEGKIRSIGVSNFSPKDIQAILDNCDIVPMVNQIRYFIGLTQKETVEFCNKHNILVEAYSPLATGKVFNDQKIKEVADQLGVSVAQLCIRYCIDKGTLPLPKTTHKGRMEENAALEFEIPKETLDFLDTL